LDTSGFGKENMLNCEKKGEIAKIYKIKELKMQHKSIKVKRNVNPLKKKKNYNLVWLSPKPLVFVWRQWSGQVPCCYLPLLTGTGRHILSMVSSWMHTASPVCNRFSAQRRISNGGAE
jgi:hypothetical protein